MAVARFSRGAERRIRQVPQRHHGASSEIACARCAACAADTDARRAACHPRRSPGPPGRAGTRRARASICRSITRFGQPADSRSARALALRLPGVGSGEEEATCVMGTGCRRRGRVVGKYVRHWLRVRAHYVMAPVMALFRTTNAYRSVHQVSSTTPTCYVILTSFILECQKHDDYHESIRWLPAFVDACAAPARELGQGPR
jgi:hypothetical protein